MKINTIVVDDFLDNPDVVRNSALLLDFKASGTFPGLRSDRADYEYERYIKQKLENVLNLNIKEFVQDSFRFQMCLYNAETWVHKDEAAWAGVLYLTPNAPYEAGTGIYEKINNSWELVTAIGNVYNRLVLYSGSLYHRSILPGFGSNKETSRLTQVFFFNV